MELCGLCAAGEPTKSADPEQGASRLQENHSTRWVGGEESEWKVLYIISWLSFQCERNWSLPVPAPGKLKGMPRTPANTQLLLQMWRLFPVRPANPTVATETRREPPRFTILTGQRQLRIQDRSAIWGSIDSRGSWSHLPRFFIDCAKHCIVRIYLYFVGQKNGDEGQCPSVMTVIQGYVV